MSDSIMATVKAWPAYHDAYVCIWCGRVFSEDQKFIKTKEHVTPRSKTKSKELRHKRVVTAAHRLCNKVRGVNERWLPYFMDSKPKIQIGWLKNLKYISALPEEG